MKRIAVIGASLAGLEFSNALAGLDQGNSFEIYVFEEHQTVGLPLQCAEGLIRFYDIPPPDPTIVVAEMETVAVRFLNDEFHVLDSVAIPCSGEAWLIDRPRAEQMLADSCVERGVRLRLGERVLLPDVASAHDFVVDASGWSSAYGAHLRQDAQAASVGIGGVIRADLEAFERTFTIDFSPGLSGYFWIFPRGGGLANVGVGWHTSGPKVVNAKSLLHDYLDKMFENWQMERVVSGCLGTRLASTLYDPELRTALIGDAAGLVNPLMGEGMSGAILSASILARCLHEGQIEEYPKRLQATILPSHRMSLSARKLREKLGYDLFRETFAAIGKPSLELFEMSAPRLLLRIARRPSVLADLSAAYLKYKLQKARKPQ